MSFCPASDLFTILEDKPNGRGTVEGISLVAEISMMIMTTPCVSLNLYVHYSTRSSLSLFG